MDTRDAGRIGGQATLKKYGSDHFKELRKKSSGRKKKPIEGDK
jgi:hypothetical protein